MRSSNGASKLYVGDLGENRKSDLTRLFSKYGEIATIYVDENKHFAFVEFTSSTDAQRALERTNNKTVNGSKLRVEFAKSDKPARGEHRRAVSRERSPTVALYSHLQVTANRLPPMPVFRQSYHHHHPSSTVSNGLPLPSSTSRGRSLTPPSLKHNPRLAPMAQLRTQDFYYPPAPPPAHHHHHAQQQHSSIYSDPSYYRNFTNDPYMMQRLPPTAFMSGNSSSRSYRPLYPSSDLDRSSSRPYHHHHHHQRRSRSRHRTSPSRRHRSSGEKKQKQKQKRSTPPSSSPSPSTPQQERERGPRTPPPVTTSTHRTKKRSRSGSDAVASTSEQKSSSNSSSEDEEEKQSNSRRKSVETETNRKHSKRKDRE